MIILKDVVKHFGQVKAVDGVSLEIPEGQFLGLLGPNGAGKTTLVEMLEGLQSPDSGQIEIGGKTWKNDAAYLRNIIGLSLQETKFIDKITVRETLDLFGSFCGLPKSRSSELLELVNLSSKASAYTIHLSGGQRQRLALGLALINQPKVLLLDEPTTGLDPNARREVWDILKVLKEDQKMTLILTTHYMEEAEKLCERIVILDQGKVLADGKSEQLILKYAAGEIVSMQLDKKTDASWFSGLQGIRSFQEGEEYTWHFEVDSITQALPQLLERVKSNEFHLLHLDSRRKTLDDLFVQMTGRSLDA